MAIKHKIVINISDPKGRKANVLRGVDEYPFRSDDKVNSGLGGFFVSRTALLSIIIRYCFNQLFLQKWILYNRESFHITIPIRQISGVYFQNSENIKGEIAMGKVTVAKE